MDNLIAQHEIKVIRQFARDLIAHPDITREPERVITDLADDFRIRNEKRLAHKPNTPFVERSHTNVKVREI